MKVTKKTTRVLATIFIAIFPVLTGAAPVTATFSGHLTRVNDALAPQFEIGDAFSYSFSYDDSAADVSGTPDYSKFATGPITLDIGGYSVSQSESFMWNGFNPTSGGINPERISIFDFSPLLGGPVAAVGPVLSPFDVGFRWKTGPGQTSGDVPPVNLSSSNFTSQRGVLTFFDTRFSPPGQAIGVEVVFSSGGFTENADGSISVDFTGEVVGPSSLLTPDYSFLPDDFQPGSAFSLTALIEAGQSDLNPAIGQGTFLGRNAVLTNDTFSATVSDLRVTTILDDFTGELEIRIQSNSDVIGPSLPSQTTANPFEFTASINDDQLSSIFDLSVPLQPFNIGDVDISGFGLLFRRNGEFDDVIGILGIADSVVFETAAVVPLPASVWLFSAALVGLVGYSKRRKAT